jgi:hypothetical protein
MAKKKTIGERMTTVEDRETILYGFMDDLRTWTVELRTQTAEMRTEMREMKREHEKRIEQNEDGLRASRELSHALTILQGEALQMIKDLTSRSNGHEGRLKKAGL